MRDTPRVFLQDLCGVVDHRFDDDLGRQNLIDHSGDTAHEPWTALNGFFGVLLKLFVVGDDALSSKLLDLVLAVVFPRREIRTSILGVHGEAKFKTDQSAT